jgi:hypothetical protein
MEQLCGSAQQNAQHLRKKLEAAKPFDAEDLHIVSELHAVMEILGKDFANNIQATVTLLRQPR